MKCKPITLLTAFVFTAYLVFSQVLKVEPGINIKVETGPTLDILGGELVLISDVPGDASLIDNGSISHSGGVSSQRATVSFPGQMTLRFFARKPCPFGNVHR